ncbi:hypothetical protein B0H10DRAFT_1959451 [Mycena sp. CBHHK59/15]|nr:hypothetical protein B0H10DRAFT_1959451 [Mycena sp. CBHHK59/15]
MRLPPLSERHGEAGALLSREGEDIDVRSSDVPLRVLTEDMEFAAECGQWAARFFLEKKERMPGRKVLFWRDRGDHSGGDVDGDRLGWVEIAEWRGFGGCNYRTRCLRSELASFDDGGAVPPRTVVHQVPLHGYTGRQTILARWNIADTPATFYACVDLNINPTNTATAVAGAAAARQPIGIPLAGPGLGFLIGPLNGQKIEHHETRHEDYIWKSILASQTCHVDTDGPFLTQTHIDR